MRALVGMRRVASPALLACALVLAGCFGEESGDPAEGAPESACGFPEAPEGASAPLHVSASCAGAEADGSVELPFKTISEALGAAGGAAAILVAPGSYGESLRIETDGVRIVGAVKDSRPLVEVRPPEGEVGVYVKDAEQVSITGMGVAGAHGAGIRVEAAELALHVVVVTGTHRSGDGSDGHGVHVLKGSKLEMDACEVSGSAGVGIHLSEAVGIILNNLVASNARGGIRIERPTQLARVEKNLLQKNRRFGVAMVQARGIILNNLVSETGPAGDSTLADGIHAAGKGSEVEVRENTSNSNARAGILFSSEAVGIILNNLVGKNGRAGIVLQAGAGKAEKIRIEDNTVTGNAFAGIRMGTEAMGIILNNLISETSPGEPKAEGEVKMGDGVVMMADAWGEVRANTIHANSRAAVLAHACDATSLITLNKTSDNAYGVVVQGNDLDEAPAWNNADGEKQGEGGNGPEPSEPPGTQDLPSEALDLNVGDVETL
jgi:parallel beta-helix repeat protein